ncbi:OmpA family protein [Rubritalea spongiae]|uniref:OmpA family protein n=1 Tax=Rubritalea spongiae TaxID=430797 RepID=A0ABW5E124_9BACT
MKRIIPITCLVLALTNCSKKETVPPNTTENAPTQSTQQSDADFATEELDLSDKKDAAAKRIELEKSLEFTKADDYLARISELFDSAQKENDFSTLSATIGNSALDQKQLAQLRQLLEKHAVDTEIPFEQIGEIKANKHARWAINLQGSDPIVLDLKRDVKGNWKIDKVVLPTSQKLAGADKPRLPNSDTDALNYTHSFLKSLLTQDFKKAKSMVDASNITDAKLAGLCIIFEEADYKLDPNKPLRALFMRDTSAGFYINVISNDGEKAAQFSIIAQRENAAAAWEIYEINLDSLLGDYANRVSDGDVYFTPLLKNPAGGDTLVIYFEFDSEGLTERTKKQLDIVTDILTVDPNRTITISGHTDSKGSDQYNKSLSNNRADSVKQYFAEQGIAPSQVLTEAHGDHRPRLPNTKSDGSDNPEGRRANRRTEIYLDF